MEEQKNDDQLLCPLCDKPLEVIVTTPSKLSAKLLHIGDDEPIHRGVCHKCNVTVPLDY